MELLRFQRGALICLVLASVACAFAFWGRSEIKGSDPRGGNSATAGVQIPSEPETWRRFTTKDPAGLFTFCLCVIGIAQALLFLWQLILINTSLKDTRDAAVAAKDQARLARDSLIASNRAWIKPEASTDGVNTFRSMPNGGASLPITVRFKNIGNAPAINASVHTWMVALKDAQLINEKCEAIRRLNGPSFQTNWTLFPQERLPEDVGMAAYMTTAAIDAAAFQQGVRDDGTNRWGDFVVGLCIDYTFPSDPEGHHQTRVLYHASYDRGSIPITATPLDPSKLSLSRLVIDTGYYAD